MAEANAFLVKLERSINGNLGNSLPLAAAMLGLRYTHIQARSQSPYETVIYNY